MVVLYNAAIIAILSCAYTCIHARVHYAGGNRLYTQALYRTYAIRTVEISILVVYISKLELLCSLVWLYCSSTKQYTSLALYI